LYLCRFDRDEDGYLDIEDMKLMMETLGAPQTHLSLKKMIHEVDTDGDSKISFNEVSHHGQLNAKLLMSQIKFVVAIAIRESF
jgi:Ca2+-binding EF-hand superfamily protein